ncbi:response regulator receiver protein [Anaeromicrobium sediminis]|uniref:Stage 0 sporulation protein A homolog n=1 Tax=Anaeromicrobium sediminis TaxID=1478221 RepID=A0A267MJJ5_9FIRM|nr:response regulator receiver protein [Anaeromicrobium sediminis]
MHSIYVVDDDISIVNVLNNLIDEHYPGSFTGMATTGNKAIEEIIKLKPDIVLLDYLLPDKDGLEVIREIQSVYLPVIIMISEVSDKNMIAKAYNNHIEFFINKPINVIEVMAVINKAKKYLMMENTIDYFREAFTNLNYLSTFESRKRPISRHEKIKRLYSKLGIIGESGCEDLINALMWVLELNGNKYRLSDMYKSLVENPEDKSQLYAIEQRIRRTITKAFNTMASLGVEDYLNPVFENYSAQIFDFNELRKQMNYLKGRSQEQGKINIRKFIESSIVILNNVCE